MFTIAKPVGIAALALGIAATGIALASPAAATPTVTRGAGILVGGYDFVGQEVTDGHVGYCINPGSALDYGQTWRQISVYAAVGKAKSQELEYILSHWGHTDSNRQAAAVRISLNQIVGNYAAVKRWKDALGSTISNKAAGYIAAAKKLHGPDNVKVTSSNLLQVGQTGSASVSVTSAAGNGVPGVTVKLSGNNVTMPNSVTTNSTGHATFSYARTGPDRVRLVAQAVGLAPTSMLISEADPGQQHLLSWTPTVSASGSYAYQTGAKRPTWHYSCDTTCDGKPTVTISGCYTAGAAKTQYVVYGNGDALKRLTLEKATKSSCSSVKAVIPDTTKVTFGVRYYVGSKWTKVVMFKSGFTVDCPPLTSITISQTLFCKCQSITIASGANNGHAIETIFYTDSAGNKKTFFVKPGESLAATTMTVNSGDVTYTVIESVPYATHKGVHSLTAKGTLTIS